MHCDKLQNCVQLLLWGSLHVASILLAAVKSTPPSLHKFAVEAPFANALVHLVVHTAGPLLQLMS